MPYPRMKLGIKFFLGQTLIDAKLHGQSKMASSCVPMQMSSKDAMTIVVLLAYSREHCRWKAAKRESYSLQINANQFSTFVPEPTELRIECKNGSLTTEKMMEIAGHQLITIQGLCKGYIGR